ncbi:hypothetical protein M405DRAFT_870326 [Rhizopogon salebrosus TDB-379]|nr:hypothetical protein M405DRAFT_870326 [Rhizopogon salebrosus TDB-379]
MSKFLACAPASSAIYSLALSTPLHLKLASETTLFRCLRPLPHEAAFLHHHLRHPHLGDLQVTAFSLLHSYWLSNPPPLDTHHGHKQMSRLCASFITHLFACPEYPPSSSNSQVLNYPTSLPTPSIARSCIPPPPPPPLLPSPSFNV